MNPFQKMRLMVARGVFNFLKNSGLQVMQINLLEGETRDDVERVQNFGFSGHPPAGAVLVAVAVGGSRDHMMVVACEHPAYSPPLKSGESAMYAQFGQLFKMDEQGNVTLICRDFKVESSGDIDIQAAGNMGQRAGGRLDMAAQGGSNIQGGLDADRVGVNGVDLETHTHSKVSEGNDISGEPVK